MKTCFVVCPIGSEGSDTRKRSDRLLKHIIEPVCSECGFKAIRVDHVLNSDSITETIINYIKNAELVIADLSEHNPNAFYEIGFRSALEKPIIHLKSKADTIPFDISTIRTFDYDLTDLDLVDDLKQKLVKTISALNFDTQNNNNKLPTVNNFNSQILQELFKIQDGINLLYQELSNIKTTDTATISVLVDKIANISHKSPDAIATEMIFNTFLNEPNKINSFMHIIDKLNNK